MSCDTSFCSPVSLTTCLLTIYEQLNEGLEIRLNKMLRANATFRELSGCDWHLYSILGAFRETADHWNGMLYRKFYEVSFLPTTIALCSIGIESVH